MPRTYKVRVSPVLRGEFSTNAAYARLDIVMYEGRSYVFKEDKAAGAWDVAKVEPIGNGVSEIADGGDSSQF